jgi:hypothetical protein
MHNRIFSSVKLLARIHSNWARVVADIELTSATMTTSAEAVPQVSPRHSLATAAFFAADPTQ